MSIKERHSFNSPKDPPVDLWGKVEVNDEDGNVTKTFRVPFTQEEIQAIEEAKKAESDPALVKGRIDGGPEREFYSVIPQAEGLTNRERALKYIIRTVQLAERYLDMRERAFYGGPGAKQAIVQIHTTLKPFLPQAPQTTS